MRINGRKQVTPGAKVRVLVGGQAVRPEFIGKVGTVMNMLLGGKQAEVLFEEADHLPQALVWVGIEHLERT